MDRQPARQTGYRQIDRQTDRHAGRTDLHQRGGERHRVRPKAHGDGGPGGAEAPARRPHRVRRGRPQVPAEQQEAVAEVDHARRRCRRAPRGRRRAFPPPEGSVHGAAAHEGEGALDKEHAVGYAEESWFGVRSIFAEVRL